MVYSLLAKGSSPGLSSNFPGAGVSVRHEPGPGTCGNYPPFYGDDKAHLSSTVKLV